ncbi:MAG: glycoside hydrolase family 97 N-terminal domain-containing protein, partial [Paramuribaculum sp.]|nr:glycoside hydrolase family 97 N-terminal domain-containing protein [Paramuribaculum sp.]
MKKTLCSAAALILSISSIQSEVIKSPDGNIALDFSLTNSGSPQYSVTFRNRDVIRPSMLGMKLKTGGDLTEGFKIERIDSTTVDETWQPVWGEEAQIRSHYKEYTFRLLQPATKRKMDIRFR